MGKRKRARDPGVLRVAVVMMIQADPDRANVGAASVALDVDGPEILVEIIRDAYEAGELHRGIDVFADAVARVLGPQPTVVIPARVGRA